MLWASSLILTKHGIVSFFMYLRFPNHLLVEGSMPNKKKKESPHINSYLR